MWGGRRCPRAACQGTGGTGTGQGLRGRPSRQLPLPGTGEGSCPPPRPCPRSLARPCAPRCLPGTALLPGRGPGSPDSASSAPPREGSVSALCKQPTAHGPPPAPAQATDSGCAPGLGSGSGPEHPAPGSPSPGIAVEPGQDEASAGAGAERGGLLAAARGASRGRPPAQQLPREGLCSPGAGQQEGEGRRCCAAWAPPGPGVGGRQPSPPLPALQLPMQGPCCPSQPS